MSKHAPQPRPIEATVLAAAERAKGRPFQCATVLSDGEGRWIMAVVECAPDGRWREVSRSEPTGNAWAQAQLAEEIHRQNVVRVSAS